jgi:hypothetical protein
MSSEGLDWNFYENIKMNVLTGSNITFFQKIDGTICFDQHKKSVNKLEFAKPNNSGTYTCVFKDKSSASGFLTVSDEMDQLNLLSIYFKIFCLILVVVFLIFILLFNSKFINHLCFQEFRKPDISEMIFITYSNMESIKTGFINSIRK